MVKASDYFGQNVFDVLSAQEIPNHVKQEVTKITQSGQTLGLGSAATIANAVTDWALNRGATHFCHWFQPLRGGTAEKHDAFLELPLSEKRPFERLSAAQLIKGEPDASSLPSGGVRSTFEARGYTSWDLTSPFFLRETENTTTLCIPTAFVSYLGEALDIKTPLLRSINALDQQATKFMNLMGYDDVTHVRATCGCEQEYFLVDRKLFQQRPDLVMTGRALVGLPPTRNQQLSDHYFGTIDDRVLDFMGDLDRQLYKLGIPAKTRHNEVAPGQFEIAPIYGEANLASDQNQLLMDTLKRTARKHGLEAILHDKPFAQINGSGKHLNWSMATNTGVNLLAPGPDPACNLRFLASVGAVVVAVKRHARLLQMSISSIGNDLRLGGHEAPPGIISVFLGETLEQIFNSIKDNKSFTPTEAKTLGTGAFQLANLQQDNTDRNRTSPFAFTGNRFEFRAVGASEAVGLPLSVLNTIVADSLEEANAELSSKGPDQLPELIRRWAQESTPVVFEGDGYSHQWMAMAKDRGLPIISDTPTALKVLEDEEEMAVFTKHNVLSPTEIQLRHNVLLEEYHLKKNIENKTAKDLVHRHIIPAAIAYKKVLAEFRDDPVEGKILAGLSKSLEELEKVTAQESMDLEKLALYANQLEEIIPHHLWPFPQTFHLLFLK